MHPRSRTRRRAVAGLLVLGLVSAAACSSDDPLVADQVDAGEIATEHEHEDEVPEQPAPVVDDDLAGLGLSATAADPFDRLEVTGLGGDLRIGDLELFLRGAPHGLDVDVPILVFADLDDPNDAVLSVPFHPEDPLGGGSVELFFTRGGAESPPIELTIGAMPRADGAWNDFLDEFADAIAAEAEAAGTTAAELAAADFDEVPIELLPLKFAQSYLDDGTENSLAGIYDSEALTDDDRVLLDAMTAQMGLGASFEPFDPTEGEPTGFRSPRPTSAAASPSASASSITASPSIPSTTPAITTSAAASPAPIQAGGDCRSSGIEITDAADLAAKLGKAQYWNITEGGPVEKVFNDISTVTTYGAFIPGIGWVIGLGGAGFSALEAFHNGMAGLNPSRITSLTAVIDTEEFKEDFVLDGLWFDVRVIAESTGWRADAEIGNVIFETVGSAYSAIPGFNVLQGLAADAASLVAGNAATDFIRGSSRSHLNFCAEQWEVDVTGTPWSRATVQLDRFGVDDDRRAYWPLDLGMNLPVEDLLRVELDFRQFRNQMVWAEFPIKVNPIRVTALENVIEVDNPMDLVPVRVQIDGAHDDTLDWNGGEGDWQGEPQLVQADPPVWEYTHIAAIDEDAFPYVISARSASTSGLRANGEPPRVATMTVRLRELIISPDPAGTVAGGQVQFTARDRNGNPVEVDWSATGGTIDANGLYTAGPDEGTFTVTAVERANPDRRATTSVEITDAECVVGLWRLDTQSFIDQIMRLVPFQAEAFDLGGSYFTEFRADGSYEGRREAWSFGVATPEGVVTNRFDGVETGSWGIVSGASGAELFIQETTSNVTVQTTVEAAGQVISIPGGGPGDGAGLSSGQGAFTCDGNRLTLTATQEGLTVVATLFRAG